MANTWICIRHPDREGIEEGVYRGERARITEKGKRESEVTFRRIIGLRERPGLILSSEIPRSRILAHRLAIELYLQVKENALFNEISKPDFFEGMRKDDPVYLDFARAQQELFDDDRIPPGMSVKRRSELEEEMRQTFSYIESLQEKTVLLVGHAGRIGSYIQWVLSGEKTLRGYYAMANQRVRISTTGITIFKREAGRHGGEPFWQLYSVNDVSHHENYMDDLLGEEFLNLE